MLLYLFVLFFFFFKQKTAYEMRISDWSSDVCSSDLGNDDYVIFGALAFVDCHRIGEIEITPIGSVDKDILFANLDQQGGIVLEIDFAAHHCADVTIEDIQFTIGFHTYDTVAFANLMAVPNDDTVVFVCADRSWRVRIYGGLKAWVQCVHPNL